MLDLEAKEGGDRLLGNGASIPVELTGSQYTTSESDSGGTEDTEGADDPKEDPEEDPENDPEDTPNNDGEEVVDNG